MPAISFSGCVCRPTYTLRSTLSSDWGPRSRWESDPNLSSGTGSEVTVHFGSLKLPGVPRSCGGKRSAWANRHGEWWTACDTEHVVSHQGFLSHLGREACGGETCRHHLHQRRHTPTSYLLISAAARPSLARSSASHASGSTVLLMRERKTVELGALASWWNSAATHGKRRLEHAIPCVCVSRCVTYRPSHRCCS